MRDFMDTLHAGGIHAGGPPALRCGAGAGRVRRVRGLAEAARDVAELLHRVEKEVPARNALADGSGDEGNGRGQSGASRFSHETPASTALGSSVGGERLALAGRLRMASPASLSAHTRMSPPARRSSGRRCRAPQSGSGARRLCSRAGRGRGATGRECRERGAAFRERWRRGTAATPVRRFRRPPR